MNLEHFDTILAFAAAMAGFSLIVTALTQAVSALFGFRGLNLKWGLEKLFTTLTAGTDACSNTLAENVLLHPLISDSTFSGVRRFFSWWRFANHIRQEELAEMLAGWKTALNLPAATADDRGRRNAKIKALNLEAPLKEVASHLALKLLARIQFPENLLTSVRNGTLKTALSSQSGGPAKAQAKRAAEIESLKSKVTLSELEKLVASVLASAESQAIPAEVRAVLPAEIAQALDLPQGTPAEKAVREATLRAINLAEVFLDEAARRLTAQITSIEDELVSWFDSSMDRVSQRFTTNMRMVTVAAAVVVSLTLVVDSLDLWQQLSRDPDLRAKVIADSEALLKQADQMQAGSTNLPVGVYRTAANQLQAIHTNEFKKLVDTAGITNRVTGTNWLVTQCLTNGLSNIPSRLEEYNALIPQAALRQAADSLQATLDHQMALGLIRPFSSLTEWRRALVHHLGGVLISIVLLSLGAPFWFNLLRSLSNLRPVLATKDSNEERARMKAKAAGKDGGH